MDGRIASMIAVVWLAASCVAGSSGVSPDATVASSFTALVTPVAEVIPSAPEDGSSEAVTDVVALSARAARVIVDELGWDEVVGNSAERGVSRFNEDQGLVEQRIQECMRLQGFDYELPVTGGAQLITPPGIERGDRNFAQQYGFGYSTLTFDAAVAAPAVGFDTRWLERPESDENDEGAGVGTAESEAYERALVGSDPDDRSGGCVREAQEFRSEAAAVLGDFRDLIVSIDELVAADPATLAATSEVTACLGEPGFEFTGFESFRVHIDQLMLDAELFGPDADRSGSWTERLVSIQQGEIRLATAFEDCAGGELGWATTSFDLAQPHRASVLDEIED